MPAETRTSACTERETMALEHPRLLAASLTAAVLCGTSCSTPSDAATAGTDTGQAPSSEPSKSPAGAAQQGPENLDQQRRQALTEKYLEVAEALRAEGSKESLEGALTQLIRAKDLSPTNERVLGLIASVQAQLGLPPGRAIDYAQEQVRLRQIGEERARSNVADQLQRARAHMAEKNYAGAVEELRQAGLTIEVQDQVDWQDLPAQVKALQADAQARWDDQVRADQAQQAAIVAERLQEQEARANARRKAQIDTLLQQGQLAFERKRFQHAQELSLKALQLEPNNAIAYELHTASVKAARDDVADKYYVERARSIRAMMEADEELKIPQGSILEMDAVVWERAQARAKRLGRSVEVDPQDQEIWQKVKTEQVGRLRYDEETGAYSDVVTRLSMVTGVPIVTTAEARQIISDENLKVVIELVNSVTLENFLNFMIGRSTNLAWTVQHGVVVIGNKSQAAGTITTEVYPVKDLVFKRTTFLPPTIRDIPGESGSDDTPRTGGEGDDKVSWIEIADLAESLKNATDPEYWGSEGVEIKTEDSGFLVVKASPDMHQRLQKVLATMRKFATPVVTIDSKFLIISRNFLQEVGVDFRGLGGSGNKGTAASLDDVTNGLQSNASRGGDNGGTGDPAASPLAGAFFNDGGDGDVRGRTENYFTSDLGRVLSPTGGLTASWTLINDLEMNAILRAVQKQQDAEIVNSQLVTILNRERGHVAVINQTTYVRDFDVEVAQASFIADPKVDVIQDGIVLDVQPVIQHDRKYIILNLNPTVAELTRPIPTFTTSLAGSTLPVTLQLPNLTVTSFATTAKVPDGGTVLLGGLRTLFNKERRAEVPMLAKLPIVSFLFKQEGKAEESRSLMVMVKATITDIVGR